MPASSVGGGESDGVEPIALPGIHERFLPHFLKIAGPARLQKVLDIGAGHGALSRQLQAAGFAVSACDRFPERFRLSGVECRAADLGQALPYANQEFDLLVAVELAEHLLDHGIFFAECARVLKPGAKLVMATPNIVSLKSRLRFFLTGFFYSFEPLNLERDDGLQHVSGRALDQYQYAARQSGLELRDVTIDLRQRTSLALLWLWPVLWLGSRYLRVNPRTHNNIKLLLGRILFLTFEKAA